MEDRRRGGGSNSSSNNNNNTNTGTGHTTNLAAAAIKKKRKSKRRRDPRSGSSSAGGGKTSIGASARGPPATPVLKVTIRNITPRNNSNNSSGKPDQVEQHLEDIAETVQALIGAANEKLNAFLEPKLVLDCLHLEQIVAEQRLALDAKRKSIEEKEGALDIIIESNNTSNGQPATTDNGLDGNESGTAEKIVVEDVDRLTTKLEHGMTLADVDDKPSTHKTSGSSTGFSSPPLTNHHHHNNTIDAKVLYLVPAKKTRRRGEKPGVAYLILTAPTLEPLAPVVEPSSASSLLATPEDQETSHPRPITSDTSSTGSIMIAEETATVAMQERRPKTTTTAPPLSSAPPPRVDYTRDVAKRRLMLHNALQAMQSAVSDWNDNKNNNTRNMSSSSSSSNNINAVLVVEESVHSKTWKTTPLMQPPSSSLRKNNNNSRTSMAFGDRQVGTVFASDDYKQFLQRTADEAVQRQARPKPAPGGGGNTISHADGNAAASSNTTTSISSNAPQQPVAALVLHLQKKQEEERKRKLIKRNNINTINTTKFAKNASASKSTSAVKSGAGTSGISGGASGGGKGAAADRRRNRRPKKKSETTAASANDKNKVGATKPKGG